jgi:hypothetical protein
MHPFFFKKLEKSKKSLNCTHKCIINKLGGKWYAIRIDLFKMWHAIRTNPSKRWHAIRTFQFMFIFLACYSDAPYYRAAYELSLVYLCTIQYLYI